ncbi:unnamed protein product [Menidia menidia]|uniref:(Atlantic silverside) hypothetical protein n=1 Tax=Menidia menidia TaxID=238744 RepID=A0A8S4B2S6_9TELE|nr:unnamed protein product [Menidia menidia]
MVMKYFERVSWICLLFGFAVCLPTAFGFPYTDSTSSFVNLQPEDSPTGMLFPSLPGVVGPGVDKGFLLETNPRAALVGLETFRQGGLAALRRAGLVTFRQARLKLTYLNLKDNRSGKSDVVD